MVFKFIKQFIEDGNRYNEGVAKDRAERAKKREEKWGGKPSSPAKSSSLSLDSLKNHSRAQLNNSCIVNFHSQSAGTFRLVITLTKGDRYLMQKIESLQDEMSSCEFFTLGLYRDRLTDLINYYFSYNKGDVTWLLYSRHNSQAGILASDNSPAKDYYQVYSSNMLNQVNHHELLGVPINERQVFNVRVK